MKKSKSIWQSFNFTFIIIFLFAISSCSKDNDEKVIEDNKIFLTCKIDGKPFTFNYGVNANDRPSGSKINFVVISGWETKDMITGFSIDLTVPSGAEETTYTALGTTTLSLHGKYFIQEIKDGKITGTIGYNGGTSAGTYFTLTINSFSQWGVKGTFSGRLSLVGGNDFIDVTDGIFSASYN